MVCTRCCIGKKSKGDKGKDIVVSLPWQHIRFFYFHTVTQRHGQQQVRAGKGHWKSMTLSIGPHSNKGICEC